jgi:ribulose-phosphate 3-epimerase
MNIIPAILPASYRAIENGVEKVHNAVDTIQIDFVDGHFAPNRTWWFNNKDEDQLKALLAQDYGMPEWEHMNYEFDLMVKDPLEHIDTFVALGPSKIIFHIESLDETQMVPYFEHLPTVVKDLMTYGIAIGIDTDPALLAPYTDYIDTIQCMGISQVGYQGQPFDPRVLEQIKKVRALFPDKKISVDGGVTRDSAVLLAQAGVDALVVGSMVFQSSDPEGTIRELKKICHLATTAQEN